MTELTNLSFVEALGGFVDTINSLAVPFNPYPTKQPLPKIRQGLFLRFFTW